MYRFLWWHFHSLLANTKRKKTIITGNMATYVLGYRCFLNYVIFLIKNLKVACLKTNTFPPILVKKQQSLLKRCLISICINWNLQVSPRVYNRFSNRIHVTSALSNWLQISATILKVQRTVFITYKSNQLLWKWLPWFIRDYGDHQISN